MRNTWAAVCLQNLFRKNLHIAICYQNSGSGCKSLAKRNRGKLFKNHWDRASFAVKQFASLDFNGPTSVYTI